MRIGTALLDRRAAWLHVFGRLKPGLTHRDGAKPGSQPWFNAMLEDEPRHGGFSERRRAEQRREFLASTFDLRAGAERALGKPRAFQRPLWVIMAGSVLLLLLASLNVAGLLLARGAARAREFTTRMAIGATRGRIAGQLLVESLLIALAGGVLGLLAAPAVSRDAAVVPAAGRRRRASRIDDRVLAFAFIASVMTAVICGLAPALQTGRTPLVASLNERSRVGRRRRRSAAQAARRRPAGLHAGPADRLGPVRADRGAPARQPRV